MDDRQTTLRRKCAGTGGVACTARAILPNNNTVELRHLLLNIVAGPDLGGPWGPGAQAPTNRGPPTNSIQLNQLQKIAPRMHQNSLFSEWRGGHPSPHPTLSAPSAPRSWRRRRSTSASGATATGLMGSQRRPCYRDGPIIRLAPGLPPAKSGPAL